MKRKLIICTAVACAIAIAAIAYNVAFSSTDPPLGGVELVLYTGEGDDQPLIVGLGGSEGGNAWTSNRWKAQRDEFIKQGYAFAALGYFGSEKTPKQLDRISLDKIHDAIVEATRNKKVSDHRIALIGGSKGAELALLLASHYPDISCVVSIVGSNVAFPALTFAASSSSWMYQGKEVPYVPATWSSVPAMMKRNFREAFKIMMEDTVAVTKALVPVEQIKGPVLCLSAEQDEMWPSTDMSNEVMKRLDANHFPFAHEHITIKGGHTEPLKHFDKVTDFLVKNFPVAKEQTELQ